MTMKTDVQGVSTCPKGGEQWEEYYSTASRRKMIEYDYRAPDGRLFSCVAKTLEAARAKRDAWLARGGK